MQFTQLGGASNLFHELLKSFPITPLTPIRSSERAPAMELQNLARLPRLPAAHVVSAPIN